MDARGRVGDPVHGEGPSGQAILGADIPEPEVLVLLLHEGTREADRSRGQRRLLGAVVGLLFGLAVGGRLRSGLLGRDRGGRQRWHGHREAQRSLDDATPP